VAEDVLIFPVARTVLLAARTRQRKPYGYLNI